MIAQYPLLFGEDGYLFFEIRKSQQHAFRSARNRHRPGPARQRPGRLISIAVDNDPTLIDVVAAGSTARGVAMVGNAEAVLSKSLALELDDPDGRGAAFRAVRPL